MAYGLFLAWPIGLGPQALWPSGLMAWYRPVWPMAWPVWPSGLRWPSGHGLLAYWPMARPYRPMACLKPQAQQAQEAQWPVSSRHPQQPTGNQPTDRENFGPVSPCSGRSATKWPEADPPKILLRGVTPDFGHSVSPQGILLRRMGPGGHPRGFCIEAIYRAR